MPELMATTIQHRKTGKTMQVLHYATESWRAAIAADKSDARRAMLGDLDGWEETPPYAELICAAAEPAPPPVTAPASAADIDRFAKVVTDLTSALLTTVDMAVSERARTQSIIREALDIIEGGGDEWGRAGAALRRALV